VIVAEGPPNNMTVALHCDDGIVLGGDLWPACGAPVGQIIINPATGVLARFYHRYARFLAGHGFEVLTYDYRGIGASRPEKLRGCGYRWRDWGLLDFEAALRFMNQRRREGALTVIGHSFGGVIPGLAPGAGAIDRMLTVGAQYAWPGDYARARRLALIAKWHVAMPLLTAACGYFPGNGSAGSRICQRASPTNGVFAVCGSRAAYRARSGPQSFPEWRPSPHRSWQSR
jgi:predicted alpha/beta hydrolase